jgi:hypothetical protein
VHGLRLREEREVAKLLEAADVVERRRSGRSTRRRRLRSPAKVRRGFQGVGVHEFDNKRRRVAPYLLVRLPDNFTMTSKRRRRVSNGGGGKLGLVVPAALDVGKGGSGGLGGRPKGRRAALNSPDRAPRRVGHASKVCRSRTRGGGAGSAESGLETAAGRGLLTPKFGKESDLWVRFDKESVWWKAGSFQRYSAKRSAVGYLLRFGKRTVELILRDWMVTWLNQGERMDR